MYVTSIEFVTRTKSVLLFDKKSRFNETIHRRLDYIFLSNSLQEYTRKVEILPSLLSDHSPVFLVLDKDKEAKRGRGLWKFNNSLLQDDSFIEGMNTTVSNTLEENSASNPHTI